MRADAIGPRTWMLGAVAIWAVLAWVLALSGLGGGIGPLPDDPSLAAELPQWRAPAAERLGPLPQYAAVGERPLFDEDRRPKPFFIEGTGGGDAAPASDFELSSVLITPTLRMAILQPAQGGEPVRMKLGEANEALPGWRLTELAPRSAVLEGPEGRRTLELRVFAGGEAPAPADAATPAPAASNAATPTANAAPTAGAPSQTAPKPPATEAPLMNSEQQMQAIRQRIEARRRQLREQQQQEQATRRNP